MAGARKRGEIQTNSWRNGFGLAGQPERINAYARAVIRTLQADEHQRGCPSPEGGRP